MEFVKAQCGGNDFIIIDSRKEKLPNNFKKFVSQITKRRTGIGADGIVVIENSNNVDFKLRYFNPDGSEYGVCGNGSLCALLYEGKEEVIFSTTVGIIKGCFKNHKAKVKMASPKEIKLSFPLKINDEVIFINFVDIGVPHTVIFVKDINSIEINKLAPQIRYHPYFGNLGTNVNFVQLINEHKIITRTYERGVEGETFSGSGSCACGIVGWKDGSLTSPIEVKTNGGEFRVYIDGLDEIWWEGVPKIVYKGKIEFSSFLKEIYCI
jgi:diaminopimelate epimerase